jgi:hypothetical protein
LHGKAEIVGADDENVNNWQNDVVSVDRKRSQKKVDWMLN